MVGHRPDGGKTISKRARMQVKRAHLDGQGPWPTAARAIQKALRGEPGSRSPARLHHAGELTLVGTFAQLIAAKAEIPVDAP